MDDLDPGDYSDLITIKERADAEAMIERQESPTHRIDFTIESTPKGKNIISPNVNDLKVDKALVPMFNKLGYKFAENSDGQYIAISIPTPNTLESTLSSLGVSVKLQPGQSTMGWIDRESFVSTYADGAYAVQSDKLGEYIHDAGTDHLPLVIAGGAELAKQISDKVKALRSQGIDDGIIGKKVDLFTLCGSRLLTQKMANPASGDPSDFRRKAIELGFATEDVNEIIANATLRLASLS